MLTAFEVGDQRYERIGYCFSPRIKGGKAKLDVYQAPCPDCGEPFAFGVKPGANLNRRLPRRCKGCRTYRGRRVPMPEKYLNDRYLSGVVTIPLTRRKTLRNGDALMEPHAAPLGKEARGIDRKSHQPHTPPAQGLMSDG